MGAESYKVEWKDNPDTRLAAMAPVGGRAARDKATGPLPGVKDHDMGGQFNNKNAGKRGISLNIRHPKGLQIAKDLVRICAEIREEFDPQDHPGSQAVGAIYISCAGRGGEHFGAPNAEMEILAHALGDIPVVGFFAGGEIARHHLYGYTGVLTVFGG